MFKIKTPGKKKGGMKLSHKHAWQTIYERHSNTAAKDFTIETCKDNDCTSIKIRWKFPREDKIIKRERQKVS